MTAENVLLFLHLLAAFWYAAGLTSVQICLVRGYQNENIGARLAAFDEASHYQGALLLPGAIAAAATGLFLWAQLDYNLFGTAWLIVLELLYILTLLVCLPIVGLGLRRARLAALQAERAGGATPELEEAMGDNAPLVFSGIATALLPAMAFMSVFRPF